MFVEIAAKNIKTLLINGLCVFLGAYEKSGTLLVIRIFINVVVVFVNTPVRRLCRNVFRLDDYLSSLMGRTWAF